ncbi:MAG: hypothetical protein LIP02_14660 [Bacteroidales bacterium]|nr:hypothetical protein [Bacteroidales bacterium]
MVRILSLILTIGLLGAPAHVTAQSLKVIKDNKVVRTFQPEEFDEVILAPESEVAVDTEMV